MKSQWQAMSTFTAPGRVNLMGDHTDYNNGFVLPLAIDRGCTITAAPPTLGLVAVTSRELPGRAEVPVDGTIDPRDVEPPWGRFVAGAVRALADAGVGVAPADLTISSTVPVGSGLSSSSALSVALVLALADGAGVTLEPVDVVRARFGRRDRGHRGAGWAHGPARIGLRPRRPRAADRLPRRRDHTGRDPAGHRDRGGALRRAAHARRFASTRRDAAECEAIAADLGIASLRDATPVQVADHPRARHVVSENARVLEAAAALPLGDLSVLGPLLLASHASLRDDYDVSTPELDMLVELLVECGAAGARLTGAGFGGCVVALAQRNHADDVLAKTTLRYRDATGIEPTGFVAPPSTVRADSTDAPTRPGTPLHAVEQLRLLLLVLGGGDVSRVAQIWRVARSARAPRTPAAAVRRPRAPAAPWPPACCATPSVGRSRAARRRGGG